MIDESCGLEDARKKSAYAQRTGVRTRVMDSLTLNTYMLPKSPVHRMEDMVILLRMVLNGHLSGGRKKVNVKELIDRWIEAVAGMCLAHSKDDYDKHDARADELLSPILGCPVAQIREFYGGLLERMKSDPRVPFLVWISFEAWGEAVVKNSPDEGIRRLKHKLAADIAELVEEPAKDQLPNAIKRALCWRDPETLKEIKTALEDGAKPQMVGRQSCLFLECKPRGKNAKKISVML